MKKLAILLLSALLLPAHQTPASEKKKAGAVRLYRFDNLDIEGHIKTPHLMYFLKRIRNKFRSSRFPGPKLTEKLIESKKADFLK